MALLSVTAPARRPQRTHCTVRLRLCLVLFLLSCSGLAAQQTSGELPGKPFFIKNTWTIGGEGPWDYMTMEPVANRLYIAHGTQVQVVDVTTGSIAGVVRGLHDAHGIALDDGGQFGYISDGVAGKVVVFDRRTFAIAGAIVTAPNPRAIVYEPTTKLLFAVSAYPVAMPSHSTGPHHSSPEPDQKFKSAVTIIDSETRAVAGSLLLPGRLGFAQTGGNGQVYINHVDENEIVRLDAQALALRFQAGSRGTGESEKSNQEVALKRVSHEAENSEAESATPANDDKEPPVIDLSGPTHPSQSAAGAVRFFRLSAECRQPTGLAVDAAHTRIFAACANMKMVVLNAESGGLVTSLPIGPGADSIGYDEDRGLIYTANGGADGSLTVIRQHVTDSYSVVQTLPTRQRARTLAVNPATGEVYLVTDILGVSLAKPATIGTLRMVPLPGSFQILVIGN